MVQDLIAMDKPSHDDVSSLSKDQGSQRYALIEWLAQHFEGQLGCILSRVIVETTSLVFGPQFRNFWENDIGSDVLLLSSTEYS